MKQIYSRPILGRWRHRALTNLRNGRPKSGQDGPAMSGFTLLEIILALAILSGSLAALGEVMRVADVNAAKVRDETDAEFLADSVMAELISGARTLQNVSETPFDSDSEPPWVYSIEVGSTQYDQLVSVHVSVAQQLEPQLQPARCELVRWLPNPDYLSTDSSPSASGSGTSGTSGPSGTGQSGGSSSASGGSSNQSSR